MKILTLGLDNSILDKNSALAARAVEYGDLVERYTVLVPGRQDEAKDLSDKVKVFGVSSANKPGQLFNLRKKASNLLKQEKYDVISTQDQYYLALLGWRLARKYGVGLEVQVHGFEKYQGLRKLVARFVLPRADAVRCVSQRLKRQLIEDFGVAAEKITVVPIYTKLKTQNVKLRNFDKKEFIFLAVGRLVPVKNFGLAIAAMGELIKNYPQTRLQIVTFGGPEYNKLIRLIARLKLEGIAEIKKVSSAAEVPYEQTDVFVLTSDSEGWGLVVIEAASYGLPIIMTDVGCAGEVIKNKESGWVVPAGDKAALVSAMIEALSDAPRRQAFGAAARRAVELLPSKQETLDLYLASWRRGARQEQNHG